MFHLLPKSLINSVLLTFPTLYRNNFVYYESNLQGDGIEDIKWALNSLLDLPGDIIECGSARCGTSILMAKYLKSKNVTKKIFACDTYEGFNKQELAEERKKGLTTVNDKAFTHASIDYVTRKIKRFDFSDVIEPVKGYFENTLDDIMIRNYCMALIDCDLQKSMTFAAEKVFPHLHRGGIMLFDDYNTKEFKGAALAVNKFIENHNEQFKEHGLLKRLYYIKKA